MICIPDALHPGAQGVQGHGSSRVDAIEGWSNVGVTGAPQGGAQPCDERRCELRPLRHGRGEYFVVTRLGFHVRLLRSVF